MKQTIYIYIIILPLLIFGALSDTVGAGPADDPTQTETRLAGEAEEILLFDLINAARRRPLETAQSLGMNRKEVLANNPDIKEMLKNGLPELSYNERLYHSAQTHGADMLANNYYSYESIDGSKVAERMERAGYVPAAAGESLGLIFFNNYIAAEKSVSLIFANMFRDELQPGGLKERKILNPDIQEAGVAVIKGRYAFPEFSANVYIGVCDFARPVEIYELQLMNLINQLRDNAWPVIQEYGTDADPFDFTEIAAFSPEGLPPLAFDASLYAAADELVVDMFENEHFTGGTSGGKKLGRRVRENGYDGAWLAESRLRLITCEPVSPVKTVHRVFKYLLASAMRNNQPGHHQPIIAEKAEDIGVRIIAGTSAELAGICGDDLHLMVADFGARQRPEKEETEKVAVESTDGRLMGLVFEDIDLNGLYSVGEGNAGVGVRVDQGAKSENVLKAHTNMAGGYTLSLPPGDYRVTVNAGEANYIKWVSIKSFTNTWLPFELEVQQPASEDV